jgi:hypothetical protein
VTSLATRAEIAKLAALLGTDEGRFGYLETVDPAVIRELRDQATEMLFESSRKRLEGIAAATRLVPVALSAKVAEKTFPPPLAARVAGLLDPGKAVEVARRLPVPLMAEMTPYLDPRRISAIISKLPTEIVVGVAKIVAENGGYITLGRFVGHLDDATIAKTTEVLSDEALLHIGFVTEDPDRLPAIVRSLSDERLTGVVRAAYRLELWAEALSLLEHLDAEALQRFATVIAAEPADARRVAADLATELELFDILGPVGDALRA